VLVVDGPPQPFDAVDGLHEGQVLSAFHLLVL
jgi:hypothetical protein